MDALLKSITQLKRNQCLMFSKNDRLIVMMKSVCWSLVLLLGLASCSAPKEGFTIFKGKSEYNSKTISSQLAKEYSLDRKPQIIVLLTQNETLPQYKKQFGILIKDINAEKEGLVYVLGNVNELNKSSYVIAPAQAKAMLAKDAFQIRIYDSNGLLKKQSQTVLSASDIKSITNSL